jgi:hypothetical protein
MKTASHTVLIDLEKTVWDANIDPGQRRPDSPRLAFSFFVPYSPSVRKPPSGVYPVGSWMMAR